MALAVHEFGGKLTLVLKAMSISRARLASSIGVDKSVVGRWCSGHVAPAPHNLERLTAHVAAQVPGFTMLDWEADKGALAHKLGVAAPPAERREVHRVAPLHPLIPPALAVESLQTTQLRGAAFEGFWRTTRPSPEAQGNFLHDLMLQWIDESGVLRYRLAVFNLRFEGWTMPVQNQLFSIASETESGVFILSIVNAGTGRRKSTVLDGISLTCLRNMDNDIAATPCLFERIEDLSGNHADDLARLEEMMETHHGIAPKGSISPEVEKHLRFDVGPEAAKRGGELLMVMRTANSWARSEPVGTGLIQR